MSKKPDELQKRSVVLELSDEDCDGILRICGWSRKKRNQQMLMDR